MIKSTPRFDVVIRSTFILLFSLTGLLLIASEGAAQTVLNRARLGNNIEDITFVKKGPLANNIVMLDGYEVFALPVEKEKHGGGGGDGDDDNDGNNHGNDHGDDECHNQSARKLFDLRGLPIQVAPRGFAYVESENLFVMDDPLQITKLLFVDRNGHLQSTRTIQYLNGFVPIHIEGLTYIPANSPIFPDRLVMVAWDDDPACDGQGMRLEVMTRQGQVVSEIFPDAPLRCNTITGVSLLAPNRLLVTTFPDNNIWTLDSAGHIITRTTAFGAAAIDGIVQLSDGRVVTADYATGRLYYFSAGLTRRPGDDRSHTLGLSLSIPVGVAWDSDTNEHLVLTSTAIPTPVVAAVSPTLGSGRTIAKPTIPPDGFVNGLSYLPDEHLIAVSQTNSPRAVLLFNAAGSLVDQVVTPMPPNGALRSVEYIPTTQQFAVRFGGPPLLSIISRTGAVVRTIDLAPTGITAVRGVAYFNPAHPSGGEFLIIDANPATHRAIITDFNGNLLSEFNYRDKLGVLQAFDVAFISTGPQAGAFSLVDTNSSELIVFRLN